METYAATEIGMVGGSCPECGGLHPFERTCTIESVDAHGQPVHPGETGARLLATNLFNPVLPLIRYELTDAVTLAGGPNVCERPWTTLSAVDGRSDEILYLPGKAGGTVAVPPGRFRNLLGPDPAVREYQVTLYPDRLDIAVVPSLGAGESTVWTARLTGALHSRLTELGAVPPAIRVFPVEALARQNGKLKLVRTA
jgi:phenylacetate-CoA ligase